MPHERRLFGDASERLAEQYLIGQGYEILDRQFLTRIGEIDLVAKHGDEIVFVEVKARHTNDFGYPEASVTKAKLRKIAGAAELYLRLKQLTDRMYRVDVIAIEFYLNPPKITHLIGVG